MNHCHLLCVLLILSPIIGFGNRLSLAPQHPILTAVDPPTLRRWGTCAHGSDNDLALISAEKPDSITNSPGPLGLSAADKR